MTLPFRAATDHIPASMQIHASCAARDGHGVLLLGPSGSGKSDLLLRLLDHGFVLVADDRVELEGGVARPAAALAGLLEVRGLGIVRLPHADAAAVTLAVQLGAVQPGAVQPGAIPRLPGPARHEGTGAPLVAVDPAAASAPARVSLALDCALGRVSQVAGAFR